MKVEKHHEGIRYTLSNEDLNVGDKVYPIARGRVLDDGSFILHDLDYRDFMCGFPDDPHTIEDLHYCSTSKPYEIRTDKGYSPKECYYKVIKKEKQVEINKHFRFRSYRWATMDENGEVKTAQRLVSACDQGHYGCTLCSNCGADVENEFDVCPKCQSVFDETKYEK